MKIHFLGIAVVLLLALTASPPVAKGQAPVERRVVKEIVAHPTDIDKDWPIIRVEREQFVDRVTGEVYWSEVVVRRSPPGYRPPRERLSPCTEISTAELQSHCIYQYTDSKYRQDNHLGGIVAHNKQFADVFCKNGCLDELYKAYRVELWWTRYDTTWKADNAQLAWGCEGCLTCDGADWSYVYRDGPFTPAWRTATESWGYRYTSYWPELQPFPDIMTYIQANSDSDGYRRTGSGSWGFVGHMFAQTRWP